MSLKIDTSECATRAVLTIEIETKVKDFANVLESVMTVIRQEFEPLAHESTTVAIECTMLDVDKTE